MIAVVGLPFFSIPGRHRPPCEIVVGMIPVQPAVEISRSLHTVSLGKPAIFMAPFCNAAGPRRGPRRYSGGGHIRI